MFSILRLKYNKKASHAIFTSIFMLSLTEGKKHDASMLADSQLLTYLGQYAISPTGQAMCLYGDPAYFLRINLMEWSDDTTDGGIQQMYVRC